MQVLLFLTVAAIIFATGESVKCYNCVEGSYQIQGLKKCILPFSSNDDNQKCTENGYCMKGTGSFDGNTLVMRQCIPINDIPNLDASKLEVPTESFEMNFGNVRVTANICDKDLCNGATISSASISFAILFLSIVLLL